MHIKSAVLGRPGVGSCTCSLRFHRLITFNITPAESCSYWMNMHRKCEA